MPKKSRADRGLYRRRGSPHWWIRYSGENGKIIRESTGTSEKKLARQILAKKKTLVVEGRHLEKKKVPKTTFFQLCDQYWMLWGQHKKMKGLREMIQIWKNGLGDVMVESLTAHSLENFLNNHIAQKSLSSATRNRHLTMLRALFNKGIHWRLVESNPTEGIQRLREKGHRTRFLDQEEIQRLLDSASNEFRPILLTALHAGMRRGEIFGLQWRDVDLKNKIITIRESKSGKKRMIPIDQSLYQALRILPSRFRQRHVFPSPRSGGQWVDFKKQFRSVVAKAEIEDFRFHDLRHTFASHLVMNGVDLKTVQELLGHSSLSMTMKYSHLAPVHRTRAVSILDRAYQTDTKTDTAGISGKNQSS